VEISSYSQRRTALTYNFKTKQIEQIVDGRTGGVMSVGNRGIVYYWKGDSIFETNVDTKATREVVKNTKLRSGSGLALNADETLLGGSMVSATCPQNFVRRGLRSTGCYANSDPWRPVGQVPARDNYPGKGDMMERRLAAKIPMSLYTVNVRRASSRCFTRRPTG
jgi:oligogalacturonide lyase